MATQSSQLSLVDFFAVSILSLKIQSLLFLTNILYCNFQFLNLLICFFLQYRQRSAKIYTIVLS